MDTPILLLSFNRPFHTETVLNVIRGRKPKDLFIFQDGPRLGNDVDAILCKEVRSVITRMVDWECRLHTFFSEVNLGCGAGPATGISWFFSNVSEGIVMEDDCLPHPDFFQYCSELLGRYRDDSRVMFISSALYHDKWQCNGSYGFSHYMITGAWASWSRAWKGFDLDLKNFDAKKFRRHCQKLLNNPAEADWWYFKTIEISCDKEKKSYWDFQMQIHLFLNNGLTIHPKKNLISNIGFDDAGTHTLDNDSGMGNLESYPILPLVHPSSVVVDTERDAVCFAKRRSAGWKKDTINYLYKKMLYDDGFCHRLLVIYKKMKHGR